MRQVKDIVKNSRMMNKIIGLLLILIINYGSLYAQSNEYGVWTSADVQKKLGKWDLEVNTGLRTSSGLSQLQRLNLKLEVDYKIVKHVTAGLSYKYMYFYDEKYTDYQPRIRYAAFVQGKQKSGNFKFSLREQYQRTIKDESDRIKESGNYDNYKINPEWEWRNRLNIEYNIPHFKITPDFSFETFYQLNSEDRRFNELRYTLSFKYKITKHHEIEMSGLLKKEINTDDPVKTYIGGIGYIYSF